MAVKSIATNPNRNLPNQRPNIQNPRQNFQNQRPTHDQLNSFLNSNSRPQSNIGNTRQRPNTLPGSNGSSKSGSKTYETANGGTITVGGGAGGKTGDQGSVAGGGRGIKITTADGETFVKGKGTIGGQNNEGDRAIGRGSVVGGSDGQGNRAGNVRGGYADSEGNRGLGSVSGRQNEWGYTQVSGNRVSGNVNSGTGNSRSFAAVRGPNGNVVAGGRGSAFVNGQFVGGRTWTSVNANYNRFYYFRGNYYRTYPNAWWPGKWAVYSSAWAITTWAVVGNYCGCADSGVYYDYEQNVTYQGGSVYFEDQMIATQDEYYDQANSIAESGSESADEPNDEEWMPLGVFAVISEPGQTQTDKVVQLAINRDGIVRGNLQDFLTETVTPISGALDKETQRVALKLEGK